MKPEDIVVLVLTASFVGFVVWLAIHTRRQPEGADSVETPTKAPRQTPQTYAKQSDVIIKKT